MGNCLKSASTDDLTLLNGRASESNRESIDQEPNFQFQVSTFIFCVITFVLYYIKHLSRISAILKIFSCSKSRWNKLNLQRVIFSSHFVKMEKFSLFIFSLSSKNTRKSSVYQRKNYSSP